MLINLSCLIENCEQNFLEGEKAQLSCSLEVLGSQIGIPNGLKKNQKFRKGGGLAISEF